jgi:hypothetical protein
MTAELETLLDVTLPSSRGPRRLELRMPPTLLLSAAFSEEDLPLDENWLALLLPNLALTFIRRVDGVRLRWDGLDDLVADAELMRGLLAHLKMVIEMLRERGHIFVRCPGCQTWETEVSFQAYALTIACPWPSAFEGPFFKLPALSSRTLLGSARAPLPRASQIRFELPSARLGLAAPFQGGVLGEVLHQPEEYQPTPRLVLEDDDEDEDGDGDEDEDGDEDDLSRVKPLRRGPGWRALLRLSRAIDPPVSLEVLEQLPAIDFFFLDLLHFLVADAPVRADTPGKISCPSCGTVFLPVRPDPIVPVRRG